MHRQLNCHPRRATRKLTGLFAASAMLATLALFPSCTARPVVRVTPHDTSLFARDVSQRSIDKIDLLFMIDNSASMGDKQEYLKAAIPDLINRLVSPNCVDDDDKFVALSTLDASGTPTCAKGELEFPPVQDLHIGIVSSSLGSHGGNVCAPDKNAVTGADAHKDDHGHLIARAGSKETVIAATMPSGFLDWRPDVAANKDKPPPEGATAITKLDDLKADFEDMVSGVGEYGCGLEAQLESWYRFLIQPDPYSEIKPGGALDGIDTTILKQRHDFLRPDSLVAIIDVSDENDSEVDVRAYGHYAANFYQDERTWNPARATAACAANPLDKDCHSCDEEGHKDDPGCKPARYPSNPSDPLAQSDLTNLDNVNLRHVRMRERFGIDPQFPLSRYVAGLTQGTVPDRDGEYPSGARLYVGKASCTNPLFAASLPDGHDTSPDALCHMPASSPESGARLPESNIVLYAHIGGVPYQLLVDPATNAPKPLGEADWTKILGRNPEAYDFSGIDPHMIESVKPRAGLAAPASADDADPVHGREWDTSALGSGGSDMQYACTFTLPKAKDCTDAVNGQGCDCPGKATTATHGQLPPLCDPKTPTSQIKAKTYPTTRELALAKKMGVQGVAASLCPIHTVDNGTKSDPLYGYRPAVASIVDAIKKPLARQCLPHKLASTDNGTAPCLILEVEPSPGPESDCDNLPGRKQPDADILHLFREDRKAGVKKGEADTSQLPVCEVVQLGGDDLASGTCRHAKAPGWCYVTGAAAGACEQSLLFSPSGNPRPNARIFMQCIEAIPAPPEN
jgi:hypothetical protein